MGLSYRCPLHSCSLVAIRPRFNADLILCRSKHVVPLFCWLDRLRTGRDGKAVCMALDDA
jgi:hypothetical protein